MFGEEFVGRGSFEFQPLKNSEPASREVVSHFCNVVLFGIQHGEKPSLDSPSRGSVNVRVTFLDPLRETNRLEVADDSNSGDWMLPKHKMQFALTKMMGHVEAARVASSPRTNAHRKLPCGTSDSIVEISRSKDPQLRQPLTTNWGHGLRRVVDAKSGAGFREDGQIGKPSGSFGRSDKLGNDVGAEPSVGAMWGNGHREGVNAGRELEISNTSDTSMLPTGTEHAEEPLKPNVGLPPLRTLRHQGSRADNLGDRQTTATRTPIPRSAKTAPPVSGLISNEQSEIVSSHAPHANVFALSSSQPLTLLSSQNGNERLREHSPPGTVPDDDDHTKDLV